MNTETQKAMANIRRKLATVINQHGLACGHDGLVAQARQSESNLLQLIRDELEQRDDKISQSALNNKPHDHTP